MTQTQSDDLVTRLLPCPFCGGEAEIERFGDHSRSTIYACTFCSCSLETGEEWGHGKRWNTRPAAAEAAAEIQRLQAQVAVAREVTIILQAIADADGDEVIGSIDVDIPLDGYPRQWLRSAARAALASIEGAAG